MGDMWLWRYDETTKFRKLLGGLQKALPAVAALKAMLDDVDQEIIHIKKNMPDHPPRNSTGRWNKLNTSIAPDQSSSIRFKRELHLEKESRRARKGSEQTKKQSNDSSQGTPPPEESSDIDPPTARIEQSIRLVEDWISKCDASTAAFGSKDDDSKSMVSVAFGGIVERPKIESAALWKKIDIRSWKASKGRSTNKSIGSFNNYKPPDTQLSNCVYDKPLVKLDLDMRIVGQAVEIGSRQSTKGRMMGDLRSLLRHKKAEKLSKRRDISITDAIQILEVCSFSNHFLRWIFHSSSYPILKQRLRRRERPVMTRST